MKALVIRWIEGEEVGRDIVENTTAELELKRVKYLTERANNFTECGYDDDKGAFWLIKNCGDNCMWFYNVKEDRVMVQRSDSEYTSQDGWALYRHKYSGRWILMDEHGKFIDVNQYRNDIASKHNLKLEHL